jgi:predicted HTH transcriptional regulator
MIQRNEYTSQYRYSQDEYKNLKEVILNYIKENGPVTSREIKENVKIYGLKSTQIQSFITHLGRFNIIERFDRPYKYKIKEDIF